jgi:hypothetical protein
LRQIYFSCNQNLTIYEISLLIYETKFSKKEFTSEFFRLGKEARSEKRKNPSRIALQYGTASEVSKIFLKKFQEKLGIGYKDGLKVSKGQN